MKEQPMFKLPETAQQVFDIVKVHLLTQNKQSMVGNRCRYRSLVDGKELKCAAGVLIPEEFYSTDLEGLSWYRLVKESNFPSEHFDLICELQSLHDYLSPECWEEQLMIIADRFKLKYY
jgi:hypothetical protein